jgi:hypothetical protein
MLGESTTERVPPDVLVELRLARVGARMRLYELAAIGCVHRGLRGGRWDRVSAAVGGERDRDRYDGGAESLGWRTAGRHLLGRIVRCEEMPASQFDTVSGRRRG